jgi:hypothetical protein
MTIHTRPGPCSSIFAGNRVDNLHRKAVILIFGGSRRCVYALITSDQTAVSQASQEVQKATEKGGKKEKNMK